jgi:hypothetical protein
MAATAPTVLATSKGFDSRGRGPYDWAPGPVFDLAFELAGAPTRPRICYLGTATGDDPARVGGFYGAFVGRDVAASHLSRPVTPPRTASGWSTEVPSSPRRSPTGRARLPTACSAAPTGERWRVASSRAGSGEPGLG